MKKRPWVSVVIPAYNEEKRLPRTLQSIDAYFAEQTRLYEMIIVDDASQDRTSQVAAQFISRRGRVKLLRNVRNRGKGGSVRRGMAAARGELCLFTDADLSTPIREFSRLVEGLPAAGCSLAIGSRAVQGANIILAQPFYRTGMGKIFNLFVQLLALPGIHDTQCGFKLFTFPAARALFRRQTLSGFGFDVEIIYLAKRCGFKIAEIPVAWSNSPDSTVSPVKDSARMFCDLFRIRWRHRKLPTSSA